MLLTGSIGTRRWMFIASIARRERSPGADRRPSRCADSAHPGRALRTANEAAPVAARRLRRMPPRPSVPRPALAAGLGLGRFHRQGEAAFLAALHRADPDQLALDLLAAAVADRHHHGVLPCAAVGRVL